MKTVSLIRFALTAVLVLIAALGVWRLWNHYMYTPWTRDARVHAAVVQVAPDVSGLIVQVAVRDNQEVQRGDVLFRIDPVRFQDALRQAQADLDAAQAATQAARAGVMAAQADARAAHTNFTMLQAQARRRADLAPAISEEARIDALDKARAAQASWHAAQAQEGRARAGAAQATAAVQQAQAALAVARLNLERTQVRAARPGHVTNLNVYVGEYAHAGTAALALVGDDVWLDAYLEETKLPGARVGDAVDIRMMDGTALRGRVQSIAHAIYDSQNPTAPGPLANVAPTFSWVRLAQRIPVRIAIERASIPAGTVLAAGMTATVIVRPRAAAPAHS